MGELRVFDSGGDDRRPLYTPTSLARRLGVSRRTIYAYAEAGLISHFRVGPRPLLRFSEEHVQDFLARAKADASSEETHQ